MFRVMRFWQVGSRDFKILWCALKHPQRPVWLPPAALLLGIYALQPLNFALPAIGVIDDLLVLPFLLHVLARMLPSSLRAHVLSRTAAR